MLQTNTATSRPLKPKQDPIVVRNLPWPEPFLLHQTLSQTMGIPMQRTKFAPGKDLISEVVRFLIIENNNEQVYLNHATGVFVR